MGRTEAALLLLLIFEDNVKLESDTDLLSEETSMRFIIVDRFITIFFFGVIKMFPSHHKVILCNYQNFEKNLISIYATI